MFSEFVFRNVFRARLRSTLTIIGLVIATLAFGLLQTVVRAWYAGSEAASATRLVTRNAISLTFAMPVYYREKIRAVPGVTAVAVSNWFGGIYKEPKNFFAQFAVDAPNYFPLYPEFIFDPAEYQDFLRDRRGAAVGRQLADLHGFKVGDTIPLKSGIYPGNWEFTVRAIYDARDETTITRQMYFHFDYLNEQIKKVFPRRADQAGVFRRDQGRAFGGRRRAHGRRRVQELARRDADRNRKGVHARLRRDGRDDSRGHPGCELHRHPDHHGGGGQYDGDDRA
jgi:putative ABC transport system permease protein